MRHIVVLLAVALGVSIVVNIFAFARIARTEARVGPARAKGAEAPAGDAPSLREELEGEQARNRELQERLVRLEADRSVLAQAATGPAAPGGTIAGLRDKLRKLNKLARAAKGGVNPDAEATIEMSGDIMEIMRHAMSRTKDPKGYGEFIQAVTEVALEGDAPVTPAQSAELSRILQEMAGSLAQIPLHPAGERLVRELEVESAAVARLQAALTPEQRTALLSNEMGQISMMSGSMSTAHLSSKSAADQIAQTWTQVYQLDAAQQPQAKAAAQMLAESLGRLENPALEQRPGDAAADYDYRIRSLRAQLTALKTLEGSLTSAQLERMRTQAMREFRIFDGAAQAVPEK